MSRIDSKLDTTKIGNTIERAEEAVQHSIERFETAMEHLAEKVEGTSQKLHHVRDVAKDSKDKLMHLKEEVQATFEPFKPYLGQVRNLSTRAMGSVRAAPRPLLWAGMALVGWAAYKYFRGNSSSHSGAFRSKPSEFNSEYSSEFPYQ